MPKGPNIRVMSFNVLNAKSGHHSGRWSKRKDSAAMAIWAYGPDLLGLQEVQSFQSDFLREKLAEYQFVSAGRDQGLFAGECVAIFFRKERFEMLDGGHFWLSKNPEVPGSRNWGSMISRIVSWVKLRDRSRTEKRTLFFFNTHFDAFSRWARFRSAAMLRDRIAEIAGRHPAIVTGDFNSNAGRKLHRTMLGEFDDGQLPLLDAYRAVHPVKQRNEGTWHGRGIRFSRRLDWILYTKHFKAVAADIDRAKRNGRYPSDHFPVTATLRR